MWHDNSNINSVTLTINLSLAHMISRVAESLLGDHTLLLLLLLLPLRATLLSLSQ